MSNFDIFVYGINHENAAIDLREKVVFREEEFPQILSTLKKNKIFSEACLLSTCNRSEVYVASRNNVDIKENLQTIIKRFKADITEEVFENFYFLSGESAVQHLYKVASGLNSMVLGEPQIFGQVKDDFRIAFERGTTGVYLNRLFETANQTAKRVRTETNIGSGAVSVAYAAVELAAKIFKDLSKHTALLIGSGETGQLVAKHLKKKGVQKIIITNRTFEKAKILATQLEGIAYPFALMPELLPEVDLIIGATDAKKHILTKADMDKIMPCRKPKPLIMIDIAVPRDFDPEINRHDRIFLNDMDSLQQIVQKNLAKRKEEVYMGEKIVDEEVHKFRQWQKSLDVTPTIVSLRSKFEKIRDVELKKYKHRTTPKELEMIERATRGLLNKIMHLPTSQLRQYNNNKLDGKMRIDVLREIFNLEDETNE